MLPTFSDQVAGLLISLGTLGPVQDSGRGGRLLGRGWQPREFHGLWLVCSGWIVWTPESVASGERRGDRAPGRAARAVLPGPGSSRLLPSLPHWTLGSHQAET